MSERGKAALTALLASINTAVLLWALYNEIVNAICVAFGYIAIMVLIERIIETEGKDEMRNEELRGDGYMAAKSDDTAAKHGAVDKLTDGEQNAAKECDNAAWKKGPKDEFEPIKEPDSGPKGPEGKHDCDDFEFEPPRRTVERFVKLLRNNCTIRHRDGQLEAVIGYAKIEELAEKFLEDEE